MTSRAGPRLAAYGWTDQVARRYAAVDAEGRVPGRIVRVDRGECDVVTEDGVVRAASDSVRAQEEVAPATGDWVALRDEPGIGWVVDAVVPRLRTIVRRDPGEEVAEQVLVANVDAVFIVHGLDRPLPPGRLERFLVLAEDSGADTTIVLTKSSLAEDLEDTLATVTAVAPGVPVVVVDSLEGVGLEPLERILDGGATVALLGASGAGKSSLVNALVGEEVQETAEVRERDARGRHTTVARELVARPGGGLLIDTPGVRAIGIWDAQEAVDRVFGDIDALAADCRFGDCRHRSEPGCAVRAAVEEGRLDARRVQRYRALKEELLDQQRRQQQRERKMAERRRRQRSKPKRRR